MHQEQGAERGIQHSVQTCWNQAGGGTASQHGRVRLAALPRWSRPRLTFNRTASSSGSDDTSSAGRFTRDGCGTACAGHACGTCCCDGMYRTTTFGGGGGEPACGGETLLDGSNAGRCSGPACLVPVAGWRRALEPLLPCCRCRFSTPPSLPLQSWSSASRSRLLRCRLSSRLAWQLRRSPLNSSMVCALVHCRQ